MALPIIFASLHAAVIILYIIWHKLRNKIYPDIDLDRAVRLYTRFIENINGIESPPEKSSSKNGKSLPKFLLLKVYYIVAPIVVLLTNNCPIWYFVVCCAVNIPIMITLLTEIKELLGTLKYIKSGGKPPMV